MKTLQLFVLVSSAVIFAGCATVPPNELVNARSAYQLASNGPAQQLVPAELHKAREALNLAEQSFLREPDSYKTKDLSYVAQRKSEQAGALGSIASARMSKDQANTNYQMQQTEIVKQGKKDLIDSEKRTADAQAEIVRQAELKAAKEKADADFQMQQAAIAQGKKDLNEAEKRTAETQAELDKLAAVQAAETQAELDKQAAVQAAETQAVLDRQAAVQAAETQAVLDRQAAVRAAESQAVLDKQAAVQAAETQAELDKQAALMAAKEKADADSQKQQADILQGKQDLIDSQKRTADALAELASLASLKEEERGLVLTLSGSILFRSAESILLPQAQVKLDQVAKALLAIRSRNLIVEGHTDSQGSAAYNQELSQRRADAVRDYLVQRGYPAGNIQSRGRSEVNPIASNASAEGRANNRRVEIVIEREVQASK